MGVKFATTAFLEKLPQSSQCGIVSMVRLLIELPGPEQGWGMHLAPLSLPLAKRVSHRTPSPSPLTTAADPPLRPRTATLPLSRPFCCGSFQELGSPAGCPLRSSSRGPYHHDVPGGPKGGHARRRKLAGRGGCAEHLSVWPRLPVGSRGPRHGGGWGVSGADIPDGGGDGGAGALGQPQGCPREDEDCIQHWQGMLRRTDLMYGIHRALCFCQLQRGVPLVELLGCESLCFYLDLISVICCVTCVALLVSSLQ